MNVRFLTLARQEVDEVVRWFDQTQPETGVRFLDELDRVVRRARAYPFACNEIEPQIRRCLFARFPYALVYGIEDEAIVVIAVAHTHRQPYYWVDRL